VPNAIKIRADKTAGPDTKEPQNLMHFAFLCKMPSSD
jgi:hypothetical protein